jgi:hypothetical protein
MSGPELAVVLLISAPVLTLLLWRLWYSKATASEQALLAQQTLTHFTSTRAGAAIDLGAGLVELTPRRGVRGGIAELAHLNWRGVFDHRYRAVYLYRSHPPTNVQRFHGHATAVVVHVTGAHITPNRLFLSPHDSAVAVRGGYRGPGRVTPTGIPTNVPRPTVRPKLAAFFGSVAGR